MAKTKEIYIPSPNIVKRFPVSYISTVNFSNDIKRRMGVYKIKLMNCDNEFLSFSAKIGGNTHIIFF